MGVENVVSMTLRMRNTAVTTANNLRKQTDAISKSATRMGTKFGKAVKATRTSIGGLFGSLITLKGLIIATFAYRAIQKFGRFIGSLTGLYKIQEQATLRLAESLASYNNYSREALDMLQRRAEAMQRTTGYSNEEIETNMALLAAYGMTADKIEEVTTLTLDFAAAKNIQLKTAFDLVGKAFVGYTGTLSRYGIILDATLSAEEKYASFLRFMAQYRGTAATMAKHYTGQLKILKEEYADLKKQMGEIIALGIQESGMLKQLKDWVAALAANLKEAKPALIAIAKEGFAVFSTGLKNIYDLVTNPTLHVWLTTVGKSLAVVTRLFSAFIRLVWYGVKQIGMFFQTLWLVLKKMTAIFILLKDGYTAYVNYLEGVDEKLGRLADKSVAAANKRREAADKDWRAVKDSIIDIGDAWKKYSEGRSPWEKLIENARKLRSTFKDISDTQLDMIRNRERANEQRKEAFKLTAQMAKQFALASQLEQAQTKYMMQRLAGMTAEDLSMLSEIERGLIRKQGVLSEQFKTLFGEYAERELGIEASFLRRTETNVEVDLTDRAAKFLEISQIDTVEARNRNIERVAG